MTEEAVPRDASEAESSSPVDATSQRPAALGWRRWIDVMVTANDQQVPF